MKNDLKTAKNNLACKEFNFSEHDGDTDKIYNFFNKVYTEFRMV